MSGSQIERLDYRFTRRTVRQFTRWGDTQLRSICAAWKTWNIWSCIAAVPGRASSMRSLRDGRERQTGAAGAELRREAVTLCGGVRGHFAAGVHQSRSIARSRRCGVVTMRNRQVMRRKTVYPGDARNAYRESEAIASQPAVEAVTAGKRNGTTERGREVMARVTKKRKPEAAPKTPLEVLDARALECAAGTRLLRAHGEESAGAHRLLYPVGL